MAVINSANRRRTVMANIPNARNYRTTGAGSTGARTFRHQASGPRAQAFQQPEPAGTDAPSGIWLALIVIAVVIGLVVTFPVASALTVLALVAFTVFNRK
jgi:hypothetical protein